MAHPKDGNPPVTVYFDSNAPGTTVNHIGLPRTSAPSLRIDTSQPTPAPIPNPYQGFEFALQQFFSQNESFSSQQQQVHQFGPPGQQQDQQSNRPQQSPQQGQSDSRRQQTTKPPQKEFTSRRHQRLRAQNPQQIIRGPAWGRTRRDDRFPPPVPPVSISPHPDHSLYPSYKFTQPNFGIVHDSQRPAQTPVTAITAAMGSSRTKLPQSQTTVGPEPLTAISQEPRKSLTFETRSPLPVEPAQGKRGRPPPQTQDSYARPLPLRQQIASKRQKRTHVAQSGPKRIEPVTPTSNPIQLQPPPPSLPPLSESPSNPWSDEREAVLGFPMPPPPHPSAYFFPFLRPVPASQRRGSPKTRAKSSSPSQSDYGDIRVPNLPRILVPSQDPVPRAISIPQAISDDAADAPQTTVRADFRVPRLNLPQRRTQTSGSVTPSLTTPRASAFAHHSVSFDSHDNPFLRQESGHQDEIPHDIGGKSKGKNIEHRYDNSQADTIPPGISTLSLPFGHAAPVTQLLNQSPFVNIVRSVIHDARTQPTSRRNDPVAAPQEGSETFKESFDSAISLSYDAASQQAGLAQSHRPHLQLPHIEPPNILHLASCVDKYSTHIQALYHIMPIQRLGLLTTSFLNRYKTTGQQRNIATDHDPFQTQVELAIEYLVFALGGLCWAKWDNTVFESGPKFSCRATEILYHLSEKLASERIKHTSDSTNSSRNHQAHSHERSYSASTGHSNTASTHGHLNLGETPAAQQAARSTAEERSSAAVTAPSPAPTLDLARAYLLAALLCGQLAGIHDAAGHVRNAGNIIHQLIHRPGGEGGHGAIQGFYGLSLVSYMQYPHKLVEDERQLVDLYWTCAQLEFEINSELGQPPSALLQYQAMIPTPDSDVLRFLHNNDQDAVMAGTEMLAKSGTEHGYEIAGGFKMQTILRGHLNNIYSEAFGQNGKPIQEQKHNVNMAIASLRQQFDSVLLGRTAMPHTYNSVRVARACSAYWEARSYGVLSGLLGHQQQVDMDDMAEVVCSMTETIKAYHGLESDRLILPNAFGTAMLQCRYLLLLYALSRTLPAVAAFIDDVALVDLIDRTLLSFQELRNFRSILEAARQVLRTIRAKLLPHHVVGSVGPGTMPELSLYCPPFTTAPGIASGIPTASTMDSFISFPTPNSPHLFPSSAFTSPQHSPSISATSSSSSPRSATFVSGSGGCMSFRPETVAALASASGSGSMSPGDIYPRHSNPHPHPHQDPALPQGSFSVQAEHIPSGTADFDGFIHHLGLSNL